MTKACGMQRSETSLLLRAPCGWSLERSAISKGAMAYKREIKLAVYAEYTG